MSDDDDFNDPLPDDDDDFNDDDDHQQDEFNDEPSAPASKSSSSSSSSSGLRGVGGVSGEYLVLDESGVEASLTDLINSVSNVLQITPRLSSLLLRVHQFRKDRLLTAYLDNPDKVLESNGLNQIKQEDDDIEQGETAPASNEKEGENTTEEIECRICDDEVPRDQTSAVACGHRFCLDCWRRYLTDRVETASLQSPLTHCPAYKCPCLLPDSQFLSLLPSPLASRYKKACLSLYVSSIPHDIKWCPAPGCTNAIKAINRSVKSVTCVCKNSFCFGCGHEEGHAPCTCEQIALWNDKLKNESETAHWIIANTKRCPKCSVRIEKNQGCNHITCRSCKYEWCWVCHGNWAEHGSHTGGFYKCNKWDPKAPGAVADSGKAGVKSSSNSNASGDAASAAKAELNRYLFYYQRYHNHDASKKFADRQRAAVESRMSELQQKTGKAGAWIDVEFLLEAMLQVRECRKVLKYTYAFAFYLPDGPEKVLFEFLQQQLETSTEHLSELSEAKVEEMNRTQIVNFTRITKNFMKNLLDGVDNGLTDTKPV